MIFSSNPWVDDPIVANFCSILEIDQDRTLQNDRNSQAQQGWKRFSCMIDSTNCLRDLEIQAVVKFNQSTRCDELGVSLERSWKRNESYSFGRRTVLGRNCRDAVHSESALV